MAAVGPLTHRPTQIGEQIVESFSVDAATVDRVKAEALENYLYEARQHPELTHASDNLHAALEAQVEEAFERMGDSDKPVANRDIRL